MRELTEQTRAFRAAQRRSVDAEESFERLEATAVGLRRVVEQRLAALSSDVAG